MQANQQLKIEIALNAIKLYFAQGKFPPEDLFLINSLQNSTVSP